MSDTKVFEAGKNGKELGIDISRKFIIINTEHSVFNKLDVLILVGDEYSNRPLFKRILDGKCSYVSWYRLKYYKEPKEPKEEINNEELITDWEAEIQESKEEVFEPQVGDYVEVSDDGENYSRNIYLHTFPEGKVYKYTVVISDYANEYLCGEDYTTMQYKYIRQCKSTIDIDGKTYYLDDVKSLTNKLTPIN